MKTGWFGVPRKQGSMVHIITDENHPICGTKVHPASTVFVNADYIAEDMLECALCKKRLETMEASRPKAAEREDSGEKEAFKAGNLPMTEWTAI